MKAKMESAFQSFPFDQVFRVHIPDTDTLHAYLPKLDKTFDFLDIFSILARGAFLFPQSPVEDHPFEQVHLFPFLDFFKSVGQCGTK